jgi:hypothetical protein
MFRRSSFRSRLGVAVLAMVAAMAGTAAATTGSEQAQQKLALPSPYDFVSNLDLECFRTSPYTPPPAHVTLEHLNPVLAPLGRWSVDGIGQRQQLCTPVAKNGKIPPKGVLEFVQHVDLSCYRIGGPAIQFPLTLEHLNPVLTHLPRREVRLMEPQQLCLPVIKNGAVPPDEVLRLVRYIDLVCYRELPQAPMGEKLKLTQLNPQLAHLPTTEVQVNLNRQLCVPVRKDNQDIPDPVLRIVQWIDLEKYDITAPTLPAVELKLNHINPLMQGWPTEPATLLSPRQLAVPMAKNGKAPPKV